MLKILKTLSRKEISMSEWCQNRKCPEKKTQSQIRGSKVINIINQIKPSHITFICYWWSNGCRGQMV